MINRTKVKESTQIKPGDNGDVLVMKDNAPEWSTPSDADLAKASDTDAKLAEKQDKLTAGDNIKIEDNVISADGEPTPIAIGTVTSGEVPMVSNSGTDTDVILNFVLPKGDKGDKGDQGLQGPQGPVGAPFQVKKIYDSVEDMNADYSGSDVAVGEFVLIDTGDVQDPDNSKLYVKGPTQYDFVTDLSGAQGIQGPQGTPGTPAGFGNITATVDNTTGTPQVSVQSDGPNTAKNISFSFTGLKGEKGEKGEAGTQVNNLAPLMVDTAPEISSGDNMKGSIAIGNSAQVSSPGTDISGGIAIGDTAIVGGRSSNGIAIGQNANVAGGDIAIGSNATSVWNSRLSAGDSVIIGNDAKSDSTSANLGRNIAIGYEATANGRYSIAMGRGANAATGSIHICSGGTSSGGVTGGNSVGIGTVKSISAKGSICISASDGASVSGGGSILISTGYLSASPDPSVSASNAVAIGKDIVNNANSSVVIGAGAEIADDATGSVVIGSNSRADEPHTVSVGSGGSDDQYATRRIVNVTDPQNAQDAATKNYVDTQLEPINAKLQYVPENTNQILSQIQTNVEKAQSAADAKVASITAGTGISVDASNPTAPVVSTTGLATQASVDALTTTVNSKANQSDLDSLEGTVAGKADTSALANYATKTELAAKADQTAVDSLAGTVNSKVSSVTAGEGISITGTATEPVISVSGGTTDTGWLEITGSSGSGLKYLTGPWTIPAGAKVKIRKFGKRVTAVGVVQATEDISSGAATSLLSIPESDPYFDAFNLPQVSQYDIAHNQQKSAATSVLLIRGMLTSFNVEQNLDTPKINVTLVPVVGVAGQTAQIGNGDTVNFQISWDTED